jgi:hypothetical protein
LELLSVLGAQNDPANWFDGCIGGSPGAPYTPCNDPIVFSEINYNSDTLLDTDDWVELHNTGNITLDLSGWRFSDGNDLNSYVLPAGTLLYPDSHLVLHQTTAKFQQFHPDVLNTVGPFVFNLSGSGDRLRLFDNVGRLQFSVDYRDSIPWPEGSDGNGYTLELLDELGVMNNGTNWFDGCFGGSPGTAYFTPCQDTATGLPALAQAVEAALFPNPAERFVELRLESPAQTSFGLSLLDATGRVLKEWEQWTAQPGSNRFPLDLEGLAPGLYVLKLRAEHNRWELPLRLLIAR